MVKLILTDSYSDLFFSLVEQLENLNNNPNEKNLIFCEAKVSLMTERFICEHQKGSFNTDVYSFGKFLRARKPIDKVLSKEGSAMAIKSILASAKLKCFKQSKQNLAPTLYDLIIQLKSAKISPEDILRGAENTKGVLKNKLLDIAEVYSKYEEYISQNGFEDQSSMLSYLPEVICSSSEIENSNVFLLGYSSFTAQMRAAVTALINKAKSVTAILVEGENNRIYVNETPKFIRTLCRENGVDFVEEKRPQSISGNAKIIVDNLFGSFAVKKEQDKTVATDLFLLDAKNPYEEICHVAEVIRKSVLDGSCRYRDITVAVNDLFYKDYIKAIFTAHEIPFFLDERKIPENHPLIKLITSYIDVKRKGFERESLCAFFKNPLFCQDKSLQDFFETYIVKYNINYGRIKTPFTFPCEWCELEKLEEFRIRLVNTLEGFNVRAMLANLGVKDALAELSAHLLSIRQNEESAISDRIFDAVLGVLDQMDMMLHGVSLSLNEYKSVFLSGVEAMELAIIPQYSDAVFVGGYKEVALAKAKKLFAIGLTSEVPTVRADVALLSDNDITALEQIQVLIEPKIRVVNHRLRENLALALCSFDNELYLSFPSATVSGKKNAKSQVVSDICGLFKCQPFPKYEGYSSYAQGLNTFAKSCGEFAENKTENNQHYDFTTASSFYSAVDKQKLEPLIYSANKEVKLRLDGKNLSLIDKITSPTTIEDFYKCPYRAFLTHALKIRERDEGEVNGLSVGNLMHEILRIFVCRIDEISEQITPKILFEQIKNKVLERDEYKKFLSDSTTLATVNRVLKECEKYCEKTCLSLKNSGFNKCSTEVSFGDGAVYPAISLSGGKVKLKGKIDRVDENENFFRVIDYKTGKADDSEKSLYAGVKLQLFLYAAAVSNKYQEQGGKTPAGLYYMPISDKFEKAKDKKTSLAVGKTLNDENALVLQDKEFLTNKKSQTIPAYFDEKDKAHNLSDKETIGALIDYALIMSERAAESMEQGVIAPLPYAQTCEFCQFLALCDSKGVCERKIDKVDEKTFIQAIKNAKGEN